MDFKAEVKAKIKRFNRYMVECEFNCRDEINGVYGSFNRYMVECEFS